MIDSDDFLTPSHAHTDIRSLLAKKKPLVMGVINCTPDSFYPGSRASTIERAVEQAHSMVESGADILDIGGESTRPGSRYIDESEEAARVVPVIREIVKRFAVPVSIDTRKAVVAREALDAGAGVINDISALRDDPALAGLVAERKVPVILMHMRETPLSMQRNPYYRDTVTEIREELLVFIRNALERGIDRENILIDPGIGFGKRTEDNLLIIRELSSFVSMGFPVLIGLSRKGFIGQVLDRAVDERLAGTLAALAWCILHGAAVLRVHDVRETVDLRGMLDAIRAERYENDSGSGM